MKSFIPFEGVSTKQEDFRQFQAETPSKEKLVWDKDNLGIIPDIHYNKQFQTIFQKDFNKTGGQGRLFEQKT